MKRYNIAPHGSSEDMFPDAAGSWVLFDDVEHVAAIVAKMRADLTAVGGFDNRFCGQLAVNVREYIEDLESSLGTGPNVELRGGPAASSPERPLERRVGGAVPPAPTFGKD